MGRWHLDGGRLDDEHLGAVAKYYRNEITAGRGRGVLTRLADEHEVPVTTAASWVRTCRSRGLIPPVGDGYVVDAKVEAVARSLGVDPEALARAVREHAGGDLRIYQ